VPIPTAPWPRVLVPAGDDHSAAEAAEEALRPCEAKEDAASAAAVTRLLNGVRLTTNR
jgi:hypothetical protein